ncbi:MAG: IMPACT family member YigZ [Candidatus Dichloromethanomonas elyunquensis]|nr:MAG: IMPACT family member YigZ [Candidatus Dichloromethanomonas elyunquensis]
MIEGYTTIGTNESAEQTIEKSKFIAVAAQVKNISEVDRHRQEVQYEYPNARHYVYAYRLFNGRLEKASDDGEPQGTGGRPVLDLLQYKQVWDVQIIVVRYFGGVLLGTGGLTRAYGGTARLALEKAGSAKLVPHHIYSLSIPYSWYEQIKYEFRQKGWGTGPEQFTEEIIFEVYVPDGEETGFENWVDDFTGKQVKHTKINVDLRSSYFCGHLAKTNR